MNAHIRDSDTDQLVVSPRQASIMLGIGNTLLYELLATGELDSYHEGRARRITVDSIRAHIARRLRVESATRESPHPAALNLAAPKYSPQGHRRRHAGLRTPAAGTKQAVDGSRPRPEIEERSHHLIPDSVLSRTKSPGSCFSPDSGGRPEPASK
jgi:hypothetical protein